MNACYVCEIPIAEKKCDHCPPNQRSNYHDFSGDKYQIQRDAYPTHRFLDTQKLVFSHFKVKAKAAISHNDQFLLECLCQHFPQLWSSHPNHHTSAAGALEFVECSSMPSVLAPVRPRPRTAGVCGRANHW